GGDTLQPTLSRAQMKIALGDIAANLEKAAAWTAEAARRGSDMIVFPELWTTGCDWDNVQALAEQQDETVSRVAELAKTNNIWINGSMLTLDDNAKPTNTSILFDPHGEATGVYRKIHLFGVMGEDQYLAPGQELVTVETPWGQSGLSVCYDLRFTEMFRTYALSGVNVVYVPAEWPHPRLAHWQTLLRARAIENQMFMIGVNTVGSVGSYDFFGHSAIIDPWGNTIIEGGEAEMLLTATIDTEQVAEVRKKIPVFADRRPELYELRS
ncbi:MAG: carbon-nitrogen family hydrolase, partial [Anaerolineae bacterium]|nr:carbon-nitrogen family hydrolase [Anaerolineae bacterium]